MRAGLVARRSPLTALARMKPALWARDQIPRPGRVIPRFQAEAILAIPITTQYVIVSATVDQNITTAFPYSECGCGSSGVVNRLRQTRSLPIGSTARSCVIRVVSSRLLPHGMVDEKANEPAATGQYVPSVELMAGSGLGGRRFWHRYELFDHMSRVSTDVDVKRVAWKQDQNDRSKVQPADAYQD